MSRRTTRTTTDRQGSSDGRSKYDDSTMRATTKGGGGGGLEDDVLPPPIMVPVVASDVAIAAPTNQPQDDTTLMMNAAICEAQIVTIDDDYDDNNLQDVTPLLYYPNTDTNNNNEPNRFSSMSDGITRSYQNGDYDDEDNNTTNDMEDDCCCCSSSQYYRDVPFAIAFWIHLFVVIGLGIWCAPIGYEAAAADMDWNMTHWQDAIIENAKNDNNDDFTTITSENLQELELLLQQMKDYLQIYPERILYYLIIPSIEFGLLFTILIIIGIVKPCTKFIVQCSIWGTWSCIIIGMIYIIYYVIGITIPSILVSILIVCGISYYVKLVLPMIPFATINIKVALYGLSTNCGTYLWAFLFSELAMTWVIYWIYTIVGVLSYYETLLTTTTNSSGIETQDDELLPPLHSRLLLLSSTSSSSSNNKWWEDYSASKDDAGSDDGSMSDGWIRGFTILFFLISLYWTNTVIMNTVQVTVAGVMATWCFDKQAASNCCSNAVWTSMYRSLTYSFGSICFGSLLQGIISTLRAMIEDSRKGRDHQHGGTGGGCGCCGGGLCFCIVECLARILEDVMEYFNQWAYVFVGIYGYSYLDSGRRVMELFHTKGWTTIITDNLVNYVLGWLTLVMSVMNGLLSILIMHLVDENNWHDDWYHYQRNISSLSSSLSSSSSLMAQTVSTTTSPSSSSSPASDDENLSSSESYLFGPLPGKWFIAFFIGFSIGLCLCAVIMNVIKGAVNTLIVCWADAPTKLQENHPELTEEMVDAWCLLFPNCGLYYNNNNNNMSQSGSGGQSQQQSQPAETTMYGTTTGQPPIPISVL